MVNRRRRRHWQRGGTVPIAPLLAGAKFLAKEALKRRVPLKAVAKAVIKRRKPLLTALGPAVEIGQIAVKKFGARRRKRKAARRV